MSIKTSKDVAGKTGKTKSQLKHESRLRKQQEEIQQKRSDLAKYILAVVLVAAGLWGYHAAANVLPVYVSVLFPLIAVIAAAAVVFFWTGGGRRLTRYVRESVVELKKVVWPERTETMRMTLFVVIFVAILALFVWGADSLISWLFYDVFMKRG